ncbi:MAG: hypothetical protein AAF384_02505 [Pseudomonadota bacterium]
MDASRMTANPTIIDVEASGFGGDSYPIEVGVALGSGRRYCSLIRPEEDWVHWDDSAEDVHHISRDLLFEHGRPGEHVCEQLRDLLHGLTVYSDGWVVDFPWLRKLFATHHREMSFRVSPLDGILSAEQMENWHATKDKVLKESSERRHRASFDAWVIRETYKRTRA